ncbi:protein transporter tim9 [Allomyces javanicus]|nr:protein transporter tim9 [Allomyces javanicus]
MDLSRIPQHEQAQVQALLEEGQARSSIRMYNTVVERCFTDCITTFHSSALSPTETACVKQCVNAFLKHSDRVSQKFMEFS